MKSQLNTINHSPKYQKTIRKPIVIADIISGMILLLMLYTSISKLIDHSTFNLVLHRSPLLKPAANILSWLIPILEICISLLLFFPTSRLKGLYASFILLVLFTGYLTYMIAYTPNLPCSCGGVIKHLTWLQHILFNTFFIALCLAGIFLFKKNQFPSKPPP